MKNNLSILRPKHGIIGHRGVAGHAPENTLASMQAAKNMDLDWIEIDIRQAKNGELVVFHDPTLERTTNGQGQVLQHDVHTLKDLDAGSWFSTQFEGERIPTIQEALEKVIELNLNLNLEVKCPPTTSKSKREGFAKKLAETLTIDWPSDRPLPLVSSFNLDFLKDYKKIVPEYPVGILADILSDDIIDLVKATPNCTLNCGERHLTPQKVEQLSKMGIPLLIYTVNDRESGIDFLKAGAFALFSDNPNVFLD